MAPSGIGGSASSGTLRVEVNFKSRVREWDEALLRAVIDIGLMGRLSELNGRWIVRFVGQTLMVIPTAPTNRLAAKPPALIDVAAEIGDVVVKVRSILPQMLFDDLDELLAAYRH